MAVPGVGWFACFKDPQVGSVGSGLAMPLLFFFFHSFYRPTYRSIMDAEIFGDFL